MPECPDDHSFFRPDPRVSLRSTFWRRAFDANSRASDELMQEHRLIERVLDALETATRHLENGHPVRAEFFLEAAAFIAGFADGCHHKKEEGVLFGAMVESGLPRSDGPLDMFLDEHVLGRTLTRGMRDAARQLQGGDAGARAALISNARRYVALLQTHRQGRRDALSDV